VAELPIVVLGSGPASLSLATALAAQQLTVQLIAPAPAAPWTQTYGMWTDQWPASIAAHAIDLANPWQYRWDRVVAIGEKTHEVGRAYGVLDNQRVQEALRSAGAASGRLTIRSGQVDRVTHDDSFSTVALTKGRSVKARLVFDGTGARSTLVGRAPRSSQPVLQTAFGRIVTATNVPFDEHVCVLMDWRGEARPDATFLYALPFGDGRWLFEETSLGRRGGLTQTELARRLDARLQSLGMVVTDEHETEAVSFEMDIAVPQPGGRIVPIGAAAALVHPATGYSVAASFRTATILAEVTANALGSGTSADQVARTCNEAMWSNDRRKARGLETYGLERLLTMDQTDTRTFFDTFFSLPTKQTALYLGGAASTKELSTVMWNVFRNAPRRLQQCLATGNPILLARSLLG
jgi:lycopene beta-cyclase